MDTEKIKALIHELIETISDYDILVKIYTVIKYLR